MFWEGNAATDVQKCKSGGGIFIFILSIILFCTILCWLILFYI